MTCKLLDFIYTGMSYAMDYEDKILSPLEVELFCKFLEENSETITKIDLTSKNSFSSADFQKITTCFTKLPQLKIVNLTGHSLCESSFEALVEAIKKNAAIKELHISKSLYQPSQILELQFLASSKKGLKLIDSEGSKFGPAYTNWHDYNIEKREEFLNGMRETTSKALEYFMQDHDRLPNFSLDFGAGTGRDTIPLLQIGCPKVWAVDSDEEAMMILKENVKTIQNSTDLCHFSCHNSPFMDLQVMEPVDLLIASYTWPYRPPLLFGECWKKCIDILKIGGYIAGHFFGPISDRYPDRGMTYHTEKEVRQLLSTSNFEIVWFKTDPEGSIFTLYGGNEPAWGELYHVVAKKLR